MADADSRIVGIGADKWNGVIGLYGDPLRMIIINKLVAIALNHFGAEGRQSRLAKPQKLVQQYLAALSGSAINRIDALAPQFVAAHEDVAGLSEQLPSLAGTSLLDLGSGNGYLGGWLSTLSVRYTGVEPSADLHEAASADPRLAQASLFQNSMQDFCESDRYPHAEAPTLITIIGVMDHIADPRASLRALFDFLARRSWLHVPVLIATFDPDFHLSGLPHSDVSKQTAAHYGATETLCVRDPAVWEELLVNSEFHVLEQRPLHITGLPDALSTYIHERHQSLFGSDAIGNDGTDTQLDVARVPPRQGPFFFWLVKPRNVAIERPADTSSSEEPPEPLQVETFSQEESLSLIGNLAPRIYRLIAGSASFDAPETGKMEFSAGDLFGQLEISCNYVSSRVLGTLVASAGTRLETVRSREVLAHLTASVSFTDKLFLSLLRHLDTVQFMSFISAKRSDQLISAALTDRSDKSYNWRFVRNIAACLLQAAADVVDNTSARSYRSRILIDLGEDDISKFIYGQEADRESNKLMEILPQLVQANVIDSFSAYLLEQSGAQESITELDDKQKKTFSPLHIGWQAARFIDHHFPPSDAQGSVEDIYPLALAISAYLGSNRDRKALETEFVAINSAEARDKAIIGGSGRIITCALPRTDEQRSNYALSLIECSEADRERVRRFLGILRGGFNHNEMGGFARKHGMSSFIVIRDIWALLACLLNRGDMWSTPVRNIAPTSYMTQTKQKPRIVAYIQESISYAGRQSGFEGCLW